MSSRIVCPNCGKVLVLRPTDAGQRIVCSACGTSIHAPAQAAVSPPAPPQHSPAAPLSEHPPQPVVRPAAAPAPRVATVAPRRWPAVLITLAVCALVGAAVFAYLHQRWAPRGASSADLAWEASHRDQLIELKGQAESLAIDGNLAEAHRKYRELSQLIAGHTIRDANLWDLMDKAKADQDRVYSILLTRAEGQYAAAYPRPAQAPSGSESMTLQTPAAPAAPPEPQTFAGAAPAATTPATAVAETPAARPSVVPSSSPAMQQEAAAIPATLPSGRIVLNFPPHDGVTDGQVGESIQNGVNFILTNFRGDELALKENSPSPAYQEGLHALCVYALLQAGRTIPDERLRIEGPLLRGMLDRMKQHPMAPIPDAPMTPVTYARSLRSAALAVYNRPEDRKQLAADVQWLVNAAADGAYTYDDRLAQQKKQQLQPQRPGPMPGPGQQPPGVPGADRLRPGELSNDPGVEVFADGIHGPDGKEIGRPSYPPGAPRAYAPNPYRRPVYVPPPYPPFVPQPPPPQTVMTWDNSNSQYGLLGVWSGAEVGVEVPERYWRDVERHWTTCQLPDGQWGYMPNDQNGTLAMTCGGVASLFVTHDYLNASAATAVGRPAYSAALGRAFAWLEGGDNVTDVFYARTHYVGYNLYGIQRVAAACGFKYFGKHDWYKELATKMLQSQFPNGAWGRSDNSNDALIDTAYTVLFLSRGRSPVLMSKLRFPDFWTNRPRDLANLARFAGRELERPLNWQVVTLEHDWFDWLDSPVLYIASHVPPKLNDRDMQKLRQFAEAGGMIFTHADAGSEAFTKWVSSELVPKLFPKYELTDLPADHELYTVQYQVKPPPQKLKYVTNGSRVLLLHSPGDLNFAWQQRAEKSKRPMFELGVNTFVYAAGKADLRNRLSSPYLPAPTEAARETFKVARVRYNGNWDPEPAAWYRFARSFQWETSIALEVTPLEPKDLDPATHPVAHLTGTAAYTPSDEEAQALRNYVDNGGVLLIDACGGAWPFANAAEKTILPKLFADAKPQPLGENHSLLHANTGEGMEDVFKPRLRPYASAKLGQAAPSLQGLKHGKGYIIFSALDMTTGLLDTNTWGVLGYDPGEAQAIVKNIVLWACAYEKRQ